MRDSSLHRGECRGSQSHLRRNRNAGSFRLPRCYAGPDVPTLRSRILPLALLTLGPLLLLTGCGRLHPGNQGYVYVVSRNTYLRDRLAVVANHVADIHNGERLAVVARESRFYKVRTADGKEGWLEEHLVIDQGEYDKFQAQARDHAHDPVVATGTLLNEIYLHLTPGRKTEHFYLLPADDKLELIERASVPKPLPPQAVLTPRPLRPRRPAVHVDRAKARVQSGSTIWAEAPPHPDPSVAPDLDPAQPWMAQPMEDWWLVRDSAGHVGWILGRSFDVTMPDEVAQYSEGRHIIGAYLLNTVMDNGEPPPKRPSEIAAEEKAALQAAKRKRRARAAGQATDDQAATPAAPAPVPHPVGQYVTVTAEYKSGLPYEWDQVRVFIWNTKKHRYETAYRLREQQGFLPVTIGKETIDKMGEEPTFTIRPSPDGDVTQAPDGTFHPKTLTVTQYRLEGGIVRRDTPLPFNPNAQPAPAKQKAAKKAPVRRTAHAARRRARRPQR